MGRIFSLAEFLATFPLVCRRTTRGGGKDCPFCHATKRTKKRAKGPNALWIPAVRLCGRASAQHDAKVSIFRLCVCKLKKLANTGVARTSLLQRTIVTASLPVIDESSNRTGKQKLLPCEPILGVRLCAQDGGSLLNKKPRRP